MNPNTGHGHVFKRPDGVKARCGGPGVCAECSTDLARAEAAAQREQQPRPVLTNTNERLARIRASGAIGVGDAEWLLAEFEKLDADAAGLQAELASVKLENERLRQQVEFWKQAAAMTKIVADSATETMDTIARAAVEPWRQP